MCGTRLAFRSDKPIPFVLCQKCGFSRNATPSITLPEEYPSDISEEIRVIDSSIEYPPTVSTDDEKLEFLKTKQRWDRTKEYLCLEKYLSWDYLPDEGPGEYSGEKSHLRANCLVCGRVKSS